MLTLSASTLRDQDALSKVPTREVLEGRAYGLQHPWFGIVNRSQADINKNVDMNYSRQKEREYFESSPEYEHLAHKMRSEYLAKVLSQSWTVLAGPLQLMAQLYKILEICRAFDGIFKEHLDGGYMPTPVLVIIDVQPKELGIPTKAYYAVEEVKEDVFNLLPNLNVSELIKAFAVKTNDMMLVIYLSSLIRSVIALFFNPFLEQRLLRSTKLH
ncbi:uncharacterized protein [Henckelia pumila]|uniref:uncharacterized protein isoform X1 n=2 Tax=Henckelia pumila TaxID=405737 RepID=UPI003C6E3E6F